MNAMGHNESAIRLAALAGDAQVALDKVVRGEADAIEGWLAYGAALNEGRALFAGDAEFGKWVAENSLCQLGTAEVDRHERAAAMWAAANADQLSEAKAINKARTLRGWHDQWKKIEQEREAARQKAEREAEQARKREEAKAQAEEQAKVESEARAEAATAKTAAARQEAEEKAEEAAAAKVEAEKVVQEVEAEIAATEEIDPETAKVIRELSKMTPEGVADLVTELRAALADEKAARAKAEAESRDLKAQMKDLTADDRHEVIVKLTRQLKHAGNEKLRAQEEQRRAMRQVYVLKKRVEELEGMEITL